MKDKRISLYGKTPKNLLGLLQDSLLSDADDMGGDEASQDRMKELLEDHLNMVVTTDAAAETTTSSVLAHVNREMSAAQGFTVRRFLFDPQTDIALLDDLKEHGKRLASQGATVAKKEVGVVLYYGAIASGLVYHYKKISSYSLAQINAQLQNLLQKPWIVPELQGLFRKAVGVCHHTDESID